MKVIIKEAIDYFKKAIAVDGSIARAYLNLGMAQSNIGQTEEAEINLQKARSLDPKIFENK